MIDKNWLRTISILVLLIVAIHIIRMPRYNGNHHVKEEIELWKVEECCKCLHSYGYDKEDEMYKWGTYSDDRRGMKDTMEIVLTRLWKEYGSTWGLPVKEFRSFYFYNPTQSVYVRFEHDKKFKTYFVHVYLGDSETIFQSFIDPRDEFDGIDAEDHYPPDMMR